MKKVKTKKVICLIDNPRINCIKGEIYDLVDDNDFYWTIRVVDSVYGIAKFFGEKEFMLLSEYRKLKLEKIKNICQE